MEEIHVKRLDIDRQEMEAWRELQQVLLADAPEKLSRYFNPKLTAPSLPEQSLDDEREWEMMSTKHFVELMKEVRNV